MTLYKLDIEFQELLELAEDEDLDPEVLNDTIEAMAGEWEHKLDAYGIVRNELSMDIAKIDMEVKRLTEKKKRINGNIARINEAIMASMKLHDTRKVEGEHFTWQIQKNGGKAPLIIDESMPAIGLPKEYQSWDVKVNKDAIRKDLEAGKELPYARIGERGESLRLK